MSIVPAVSETANAKEHPLLKPVQGSKTADPAASAEAQPKQLGSVGQLAGVAAMGLAAGLAVAGASELADAAVISTLIAVGEIHPCCWQVSDVLLHIALLQLSALQG